MLKKIILPISCSVLTMMTSCAKPSDDERAETPTTIEEGRPVSPFFNSSFVLL